MTLTQLVAAWALRAMVVWAAVEGGVALYDEGARQAALLAKIKGHSAIMGNLHERGAHTEHALIEETAQLQRMTRSAFRDPGAIAPQFRDALNALGARDPIVETSAAPLTAGLARVTLDVRWREGREAGPAILRELALSQPSLSITDLSLEKPGGADMIEGRAKLQTITRMPETR